MYKWFVFTLLIVLSVPASAKHKKNKADSYARVLGCYTQRILPGARNGQITTRYRILLIWKSSENPLKFFWRGDNGYMACATVRIHKTKGKPESTNSYKGTQAPFPYTTEKLPLSSINKGDTLELVPVAGGKFPVPENVPATAKNTLYFETDKTQNLALPMKTIVKEKDIAMP